MPSKKSAESFSSIQAETLFTDPEWRTKENPELVVQISKMTTSQIDKFFSTQKKHMLIYFMEVNREHILKIENPSFSFLLFVLGNSITNKEWI